MFDLSVFYLKKKQKIKVTIFKILKIFFKTENKKLIFSIFYEEVKTL